MHEAAVCFLCPDGSGGGVVSSHCCMPFNTRMLFIGDSTMRCALARAGRSLPLPTMLTSPTSRLCRVARDCSRQISSSHSCTRCDTVACGRKMPCVYMWLLRPSPANTCTSPSDTDLVRAQNQSIVNERTFATWPDFFNHTTIDVAPFGHCECYRGGAAISFENRSVMTYFSASRLRSPRPLDAHYPDSQR